MCLSERRRNKITRIFEPCIATADMGLHELKCKGAEKKRKEADIPPERNTTEKDKDEALLDA
jgi:hypothetical protein